jgi:TPR repeat protein
VPQNDLEAEKWMIVAAEGGLAEAQFQLAQFYNRGLVYQRDNFKAHKWAASAAEQGHALAQEFIGIMHHDGIQVEKDLTKALEWFVKSAQSGNASAQFRAASMFLKGDGADIDAASAYVFASLAAAKDYPKAEKLRSKASRRLSKEERTEADELIKAALGQP